MIKLRHFSRERMRLCAQRLYVCLQSLLTCCVKGDSQQDHGEPRPDQDVPDCTNKSKGKTPQDPEGVKRASGTFEKSRSTVFEDAYIIKCSLGAGAFARTVIVSSKATGSISVAKIPLEKGTCKNEICSEIAALSTLDHLNIIKLVDVAKDRGCKIIITEYCPGGTLLAAMERHSKSPSLAWGFQIISYFRQLVSAVSYMHSNQWAHLDLKQDNVVLSADLKVVKILWCMLDPRPETRSTIWQVEEIKFKENQHEH
ncbi:putative serine/threonine-protein kinase nek1 [Oratosquilla oratoria]|uniref:putative serine/threonine-protein kinase nek1 n=1 Tax=Oratosquilla oratoria TaxID=337810 RepID=UPI003F75A93F